MDTFFLLAQRNEELNRSLAENPMVLGAFFLVIGLAVGGWGLYELLRGVSYSKYGRAIRGGQAKVVAILRVVAGACCILFALYKMLLG